MLSIDVLTSAGTLPTLKGLIGTVGTTLMCIEELAGSWASARIQQRTVSNRLKQLTEIAVQDNHRGRADTGPFWRIRESLEAAFGDDDALYKTDDGLLLDIVGQLASQ